MTSILSLFLILAMVFSGGLTADKPNDYASTNLTISDVSLTCMASTYDLEPSVRMGIATWEDNALLDFDLVAAEKHLFPTQFMLNQEGLSMERGDNETVYTLSSKFLETVGEIELTQEDQQVLDSLCVMLRSLDSDLSWQPEAFLTSADMTNNLQMMMSLTEPLETEKRTLGLKDGETEAHYSKYVLDHKALIAYLEKMIAQDESGYWNAYLRMLSLGLESKGESEASALENLLAQMPFAMELTLEETLSDAGAGLYEMNLAVHVDGDNPSDATIPIRMMLEDGEYTFSTSFEEEEGTFHMTGRIGEKTLDGQYDMVVEGMSYDAQYQALATSDGYEGSMKMTASEKDTEFMDAAVSVQSGADSSKLETTFTVTAESMSMSFDFDRTCDQSDENWAFSVGMNGGTVMTATSAGQA